jgi:chloramphenicol 3-O-phosphotransferase
VIINISGTSGSGKTTLARAIMNHYTAEPEPILIEGRRRPIGYRMHHKFSPPPGPLFVVGSYESTCGGCDTIAENQFDTVYRLVREHHDDGCDVLFEGLLITAEVNRAVQLRADGYPLVVLSLTTPVELCIESVNVRRRARKADAPPVKEANTRAKHRQNQRRNERLRQGGVPVHEVDREEALRLAVSLLLGERAS